MMWPALLVSAWCLVWAAEVAQTVWVPTGQPTECLPENPPVTTYNSKSLIICAMISTQKRAARFFFSGGVCTLVAEGLEPLFQAKMYTALPESLQEVANGKNTFGSPALHSSNHITSLAVDGKEDTMYHSNSNLVYPWWVVDLGSTRLIHLIQIYSRQSCCDFRFHDIEIRVGVEYQNSGNFSSYTFFSTYIGPYKASYGHLTCLRGEGVTGRYVSIQRVTPEDDMLQLLEVEVFVASQ